MRGVIAILAAAGVLVAAPAGKAEAPEFLTRMPTHGIPGEGAGELDNPRGITANPATGRIFVAELNNFRISEYTAWGLFVRAWGWNVAPDGAPGDTVGDGFEICGPPEPVEMPTPGFCQVGAEGSGVGQFNRPTGVTVDPTGDVYVVDRNNLRVQRFSPSGAFELMFGGKVNKTKVEVAAPAQQQNVCPVDPSDVCQTGSTGTAPSHFVGQIGNYIAYSPAGGGAIVVGDKDRIQIFNLDGTYRESIPFTGALAVFAGKPVNALAVDSAGNIYFSVSGLEDLYKLSPTGVPLAPGKPGESKFDVEVPLGVAVDHNGNVYAIDDPPAILAATEARVIKFNSASDRLIPTEAEEDEGRFFPYIPFQGPALTGIATGICTGSAEPGNLYLTFFSSGKVAHADAYGGPPIGCENPPLRAPVISEQYAAEVGSESAKVQAHVNPKFWPDATYYVEYGESPCSAGGCTSQAPLTPALLTEQSINKALRTVLVSLNGLEPGTTYHYRFVAESGGGGPVHGIDPDGEGPDEATAELGREGSFRTLNRPTPQPACPNGAFRKGAGAHLPDCRAYEMVSPLDKKGGDVALWKGRNALFPLFFELNQSAPSGERFAFTSAYSFVDPEAAPFVSQYLAERSNAGWGSEAISPPRTLLPVDVVAAFGNEFQGFSPDLCRAWLFHFSAGPLSDGAIPRYPNLYRRDNCAELPAYQALTTVEPPNRSPDEYSRVRALGASADGAHTIFAANDALLPPDTPSLPDKLETLLYEHTPDGLRFVCYLPDGTPSPEACGAGLPGSTAIRSSVHNAISADGSRIFWSTNGSGPAVRRLYARIGGVETIAVSGAVAPDSASYWTAAGDGSKVIFAFHSGSHEGELYEFDVDTEVATLIAEGVEGPMGASSDASRIYFASTEDLDGGSAAMAGDHNLYFYDANAGGGAGTFTFIMPLAAADITGSNAAPAPIDEAPNQRAARVTTDGLHATFTAVAPPPSGYDNREATSDAPAQEVYRYDAEANELACISCNPTGARPVAEEFDTGYYAVAQIQGWEVLLHAPRVISDDGSRVFFESFEALVPRDTNGTWDVYQWEEPGKGTCDTKDATYSTETGGCVDLISSGESKAKSTFLDADPSGDNIFFSTQSSLVGQDYGLNDVYVARVGGGFPEPSSPPICEGEACQSPAAAPSPPSPSSSSYRQPSQLEPKPRPRCPKGKRRVKRAGKVRCVKKRKGAKAGKRNQSRRAAR